MTLGFSLTILISLSIAILGLLVFLNNPKNKTNKLFVVLVFCIIVWIGSNFLENETTNLNLASFFLRLDFASASILVYFWFLFCLNFPQTQRGFSLAKKIIIVVPAIFFAVLSFSNLIIENIRIDDRIIFNTGKLFPFYIIYVLGYMVFGGGGSLLVKYRKVQPLQRTQILYLLIGALTSALIGAVVNLFLQQFLPVELFRFGIYGVIFLVGFTAYAIIKKDLFGVRVVLTALFVVLIALLLLLDALVFTENLFFQVAKAIILIIFLFFGYSLIRSVVREMKYREQIKNAYEVEKNARKELERLDAAKNQFLLATQHHLRTPLTAMRGYIDLLMTGSYGRVPKRVEKTIKKFEVSTNRLLRVVNELLDVSQFQLGKKVVTLRPNVDIDPIIEEIIEELKFETETKHIYLKLEKLKDPPTITADAEKLKVALFNLVDNSIKYTRQGGVKIEIEPAGSKVLIIIQDTGIGILKEDLPVLFNRTFERSSEAQKIHTTGRGIGLYIANQIIQAHNGKVWAESAGKGMGTTFYVELPVG